MSSGGSPWGIFGDMMGARGSERAAETSADAAAASANLQNYQFQQSRADLAPYRYQGVQALNLLGSFYGLDPWQGSTDVDYQNVVNTRTENHNLWEEGLSSYLTPGTRLEINPNAVGAGSPRQGGNYLPGGGPASREGFGSETGRPLQGRGGGHWATREGGALGSATPASQSGQSGRSNALAQFFQTPDYQFTYDEGLRALQANQSGSGSTMGSRAMRQAQRYGQGLASTQLNNVLNRLSAIAGIGQTATNTTGQLGANAAANTGNALQNMGDARGSGYIGRANGINRALSGIPTGRQPQQQPTSTYSGGDTSFEGFDYDNAPSNSLFGWGR